MQENIIIKGTPQKNKIAQIITVIGAVLLPLSFVVATYVFYNCKARYCGYRYEWSSFYNDKFGYFFREEFFSIDCYYGYITILGAIAVFAGIIIKLCTEKCEITVTNDAVFGKLSHGKNANIPLNQITAISRCFFNGISVVSIGSVNNFYCFENYEEVIKAISYLLANPMQSDFQAVQTKTNNEAEQLNNLKELWDSGVLTQEEFDTKKKQILGL